MNNQTSEIHSQEENINSLSLIDAIKYAQSLWFWLDFEEGDNFLEKRVYKFYNPKLRQCLIFSLDSGFFSCTFFDKNGVETQIQNFPDGDTLIQNDWEFSYTNDSVTLIVDSRYRVLQKILMQVPTPEETQTTPQNLYVPAFKSYTTFWQ